MTDNSKPAAADGRRKAERRESDEPYASEEHRKAERRSGEDRRKNARS